MFFKRVNLIIFVFAFIFPVISSASKNVVEYRKDDDRQLLFDDTPRFDNLSFDIDESNRLKPKANDFELLHFAPMSNKIGERWVLITVKNTSTGHRLLKSEHIVATFANEEQRNPKGLNESIDGGQIFSKAIYFGVNKFPIVMLEIQP